MVERDEYDGEYLGPTELGNIMSRESISKIVWTSLIVPPGYYVALRTFQSILHLEPKANVRALVSSM